MQGFLASQYMKSFRSFACYTHTYFQASGSRNSRPLKLVKPLLCPLCFLHRQVVKSNSSHSIFFGPVITIQN